MLACWLEPVAIIGMAIYGHDINSCPESAGCSGFRAVSMKAYNLKFVAQITCVDSHELTLVLKLKTSRHRSETP